MAELDRLSELKKYQYITVWFVSRGAVGCGTLKGAEIENYLKNIEAWREFFGTPILSPPSEENGTWAIIWPHELQIIVGGEKS